VTQPWDPDAQNDSAEPSEPSAQDAAEPAGPGGPDAGHGYPSPGYPQPGGPAQQYAQPGYAQPGYAQPGYGPPGQQPPAGYPQQGHPQQSYPQQGYQPSQYGPQGQDPATGYPQQGHQQPQPQQTQPQYGVQPQAPAQYGTQGQQAPTQYGQQAPTQYGQQGQYGQQAPPQYGQPGQPAPGQYGSQPQAAGQYGQQSQQAPTQYGQSQQGPAQYGPQGQQAPFYSQAPQGPAPYGAQDQQAPPQYPPQDYPPAGYQPPGPEPQSVPVSPGGEPPGRTSRRRRPWLLWAVPGCAVVVAGIIVAVLALGGGGGKGSGGGSGAPPMKLNNWQTTQPQYDAMGAVTYGTELVVTADTGVYAYNRGTGKLMWTVKPPGAGAQGDAAAFCGSGQSAVDGRLAVGFGPQKNPTNHLLNCISVGVIDLKSGRMLWTHQIPTAAQLKANVISTDGVDTEIVGNTVLATWNNLGAAYSASTGHQLWSEGYSDQFRDLAVADGRFYGLFRAELPGHGIAPMALDGINPANGDITSRLHMTGGMTHTGTPAEGAIISTSPMTLLISDESSASEASYVVLDSTNQHIAQVIQAGPQFPGNFQHMLDAMQIGGNSGSHPYIKAVTGGGSLITVSYPAAEQSDDKLIAYSLSTGAVRWSLTEKGIKMIAPVAVDGSTVIAVGSTDSGLGNPTLVRVSLASGKVLSSTPRKTGADPLQGLLDSFHFTWADGRVYAVAWDQAPDLSDTPGLFTMSAPGK
jgi:outer membrane protein assembly factor BamB